MTHNSEHKYDSRIFWSRDIPMPKWYRPLKLFRWMRGYRKELIALEAKPYHET